jgi:predicted O-linked N-acetylglucosamine transferase (SPINDLY family)
MGIKVIDYFLSDNIESPPEHDALYTEKIHRLPRVYACYEPPVDAPNVSHLPALQNGYVTFGCLNKSNKIGDASISLWSKCLALTADSRLILQGEVYTDENIADRVRSMFAAHGIAPQRIECRSFAPHPDLFLTYNDIDIALDPHPYSGCLTTCESLWMGVPVATLPGPTFAGRHSASFLTAVGLEDWIADSEQSFIDLIEQRSNNLEALAKLRNDLRERMTSSPLCDAEQFGQDLGQALKDMWKEKILNEQ